MNDRSDEVVMRCLEDMDERLRIGENAVVARRQTLKAFNLDSEQLYSRLERISSHAVLMRTTLEKGMEFRYQSYRILLDLIRQEQYWNRQRREILSQHRIQASIMRMLPLVMMLFLIPGDSVQVGIYSISLWMHLAGEVLLGILTEELTR